MGGSPEAKAPSQILRFLGLAFAGADMVFEVDTGGLVTLVLGASERLTGHREADLVGKSWSVLLAEDEADLLPALLAGLKPGERQGPLRVALPARAGGGLARFASLSVFRLPQLGSRISCALALGASAGLDLAVARSGGLMAREAFTDAAARLLAEADQAGLPLRLDLVEMGGLAASLAGLEASAGEDTRRRLAATLRAESYAGLGAAEIAQDRYALVRSASAPSERLTERLNASVGGAATASLAQLPFDAASPAQNVRAMRYALDRYIEDGPEAAAQGFRATVERTVRDTDRFRKILTSGAFHLAYQPVVSLADERLHHFEALARFDANSSPADTIRLAEELDMIYEFDQAVLAGVVQALAASPAETRIAANISARSLTDDRFLVDLAAATAAHPKLHSRLLLEVTETRQIDDLDKAGHVLARLREIGHVVCLDDFGAGAASLDYLRKLQVDFVKIDGRYIQSLQAGSRDAVVVKHVVGLCAELGIATIAEMIETPQTARLARELGVTLGQGWAFSRPLPEPKWRPDPGPPPARRAGAREEWG